MEETAVVEHECCFEGDECCFEGDRQGRVIIVVSRLLVSARWRGGGGGGGERDVLFLHVGIWAGEGG
eukprot:1001381-Rhodomonas_salina.1